MLVRFDTDDIRPHERQAFWQDVVCATFVPLECRIDAQLDFDGRLCAHDLDVLRVVEIRASRQLVRRDRHCIARSPDEYVLINLAHEGCSQVIQDGREAALAQGDFAVYDTRQPYELHFSGSFRQTVLQVPCQALRERIGNIEQLTALALSRKDPVARLAFDYLTGLARLDDSVSSESRRQLTQQGLDLLATALAERGKGIVQPSVRRTSLLYRIKRHVRANLADSELSLTGVAGAFGVTPRYINSLFQDEQTSFGRFLLDIRLQACADQLGSLSQRTALISTLAYRSGFTDMAYFSRVFKARFGCSARDFRHATMLGIDSPQG
ncbi:MULTISPECIES: helix-turn-helix domain-containing protein [Pseudomonas]|uniref:Helix-turn-helix domain-containing protein n=1 Tax=Pseudomonas piscis TaxID=2614538 RepID=A0ABY9NER9_9PSED|nr:MULTISPECIES: helix-turn-helix domain-containing protein [Pseudomonas]WMN17049.1 helix-turn-helix domain-containing protein [Pseudomonas piscis]